jgi:hypothetical protein
VATKTGDVKQDSWPYELDFVVGDGVIPAHAGIPRRLLCDYSEEDPVMRRGDAWARAGLGVTSLLQRVLNYVPPS